MKVVKSQPQLAHVKRTSGACFVQRLTSMFNLLNDLFEHSAQYRALLNVCLAGVAPFVYQQIPYSDSVEHIHRTTVT